MYHLQSDKIAKKLFKKEGDPVQTPGVSHIEDFLFQS